MNYNYFDTIDTEEKAYWLGFLFADGNLSIPSYTTKEGKIKNGRYKISLELKAEDIEHLKKFAKAINYEKEIKIAKCSGYNDATKRCRLMFNNKHMWNTLNNLGCTPRKSLTLKFPDITIFSNYWLIYSFIRGYFDGDGTISYCNNTHNKMQIKALGTSEFLSEMQKQLPLEYDNILYQREGSKVYELSFNAKRGAYVSSILYNGAEIYLERKYLRYKEFCRLYKGLYRELSSKYGKDRKVNSVVNSQITEG